MKVFVHIFYNDKAGQLSDVGHFEKMKADAVPRVGDPIQLDYVTGRVFQIEWGVSSFLWFRRLHVHVDVEADDNSWPSPKKKEVFALVEQIRNCG
jgi:hypothetical protein